MEHKYKRIFVVVIDSMGIGQMADAAKFDDVGADTLGHISEAVDKFDIPNLRKLGIANLKQLKQVFQKSLSKNLKRGPEERLLEIRQQVELLF